MCSLVNQFQHWCQWKSIIEHIIILLLLFIVFPTYHEYNAIWKHLLDPTREENLAFSLQISSDHAQSLSKKNID